MTDYEQVFKEDEAACGEPFEEFVEFFRHATRKLTVLDLGSGQGRDSLVAGTHGHSVIGIDLSPTGVAQTNNAAKDRGLDVIAEVGDLRSFESKVKYDTVILDRIVHMLRSDVEKKRLIRTAQDATKSGGYTLIADTPSNMNLIDSNFSTGWETKLKKKNIRIYRGVGA